GDAFYQILRRKSNAVRVDEDRRRDKRFNRTDQRGEVQEGTTAATPVRPREKSGPPRVDHDANQGPGAAEAKES
ncbi:unnamed protein product, partial [Amoebophrya sp. A120]